MRGQVLGEVVGAREALAAHITVVRPLAGVDAQMARQVALAAERAPAKQAHERPLARVLPHVQLQVLLRPHALPAERTREPTLPLPLGRVRPQKTQNRRFLRVPERVPGAAPRRERHRVDRVVLLLLLLRRRSLPALVPRLLLNRHRRVRRGVRVALLHVNAHRNRLV